MEPTPLIIALSIILTVVSIAERLIRNRKKFKHLEKFLSANKKAIEKSIREGSIDAKLIETTDLKDLPDILEELAELEDLIDLEGLSAGFRIPTI